MAEIHNIKATLIQKHGTASYWASSGYTPQSGEIIVYDDLHRIKIGDGENEVQDLKFVSGVIYDESKESIVCGPGISAPSRSAQSIIGQYNDIDINTKDTDRLIIGCGASNMARENCFTTGKDNTGAYITIGSTKLTETELQNLLLFIRQIGFTTISGGID